jgi:CBS domain-containing protein
LRLSEIMTRTVELIGPDDSLRAAARMMRDIDSGFLPVADGDRLVGAVTDRDIAVRGVAEGLDPERTRVREVMSDAPVCCYEDQDEDDAARMMAEMQVRRLPVLDRGDRLVGVVSLGDLARRLDDPEAAGRTLDEISDGGAPRTG